MHRIFNLTLFIFTLQEFKYVCRVNLVEYKSVLSNTTILKFQKVCKHIFCFCSLWCSCVLKVMVSLGTLFFWVLWVWVLWFFFSSHSRNTSEITRVLFCKMLFKEHLCVTFFLPKSSMTCFQETEIHVHTVSIYTTLQYSSCRVQNWEDFQHNSIAFCANLHC